MADINFGNELQKPIEIAGHKVPIWVLVLGALVAAFAILTRSGSGSTTSTVQAAQPADSGATPAPVNPTPTPAPLPDNSGIGDLTAKLQGFISGTQSQIATLNAEYGKMNEQRQADLKSEMAAINSMFAAERASQTASLQSAGGPPRASSPSSSAAPPAPVQTPVNDPNEKYPTYYTVVSGDNLTRIANRYGITVQSILNLNPQITNPNLIYPGQKFQLFQG